MALTSVTMRTLAWIRGAGAGVAVACLVLTSGTQAQNAVPAAPSSQQPPAQLGTAQSQACGSECVRDNTNRALGACIPRIEAEAPGDFDWVYRPNASVFQEASPPEPGTAIIRYRGDSVRFLNPQEKWVRVMYECGFDAAQGEVAYVRVRAGVLGKASAVPSLPAPARGQTPPQPRSQPRPQGANPAQTTLDLRRIGEPSDVNVYQIPPGAKPPRPAAPAQAGAQ